MKRAVKAKKPKPASKPAMPANKPRSASPSLGGGGRFRRLRWGAALVAVVVLGAVAEALLTLPSEADIATLAQRRPRSTALIDTRVREAHEAHQPFQRAQTWVAMSEIAPELIAAVLASEDARFFQHDGVDLAQLKKALGQDIRAHRLARGASTLTQQLAKNLWLSERKTPLRKLQEVVLARRLEDTLTKERILELYLNEVEWGDGIYGCEAASHAYFGHRCRDLSLAEAAELAAMLPAPRQLQPWHAPDALRERALHVLQRVEDEHLAPKDAVVRARDQVDRSRTAAPSLNPGA